MGVRTATSLHRTYDADPDSVRAAREATVGFAAAAGFDAARLADVWLASSEALTNVVKHAYEVQGGKIELDVAITGNELCILIADEGRGLRPHPSGRGLGLGLMLIVAVSDEAAIWKRAGGGTAVSMRFGLEGSEPSGGRRQSRGSVCSATAPATSRFSTTT